MRSLVLILIGTGVAWGHGGGMDDFGGHWSHTNKEYHCHSRQCQEAREAGHVPYEPLPSLLKVLRSAGLDWRLRYGGFQPPKAKKIGTERPSRSKMPNAVAPPPQNSASVGPAEQCNRHFELASREQQAGNTEKAVSEFQKGLRIAEDAGIVGQSVGSVYYVTAQLEVRLGNRDASESAYTKAIAHLHGAKDPERVVELAWAMNNLQSSRLNRNLVEDSCDQATIAAIRVGERALAEANRDELASFWDTRASCLSAVGKTAEAGHAFEAAMSLLKGRTSNFSEIVSNYADFLARNGKRIESLRAKQYADESGMSNPKQWQPISWQ